MKRTIGFLALLLGTCSLALADNIRVGTLNCYLFFQPEYSGNSVSLKGRPTAENYPIKVQHLAGFVTKVDVVGLEETERNTVSDLAQAAQYGFTFVQGHDTYTGENTGILTQSSLRVQKLGRIGELDRTVSKHTLVRVYTPNHNFLFLVVHLIRPIGAQATKHEADRK